MQAGAYIVAASRTPIARLNGGLAGLPATNLGASLIAAIITETGLASEEIDEIVLGQVLAGGAGQNPARQAALQAGVPVTVPAMTINKVCGAGQKSIHLAAQAIRCQDAEIVVAGGQDSMTEAPLVVHGIRGGHRMGDVVMRDSMLLDGLVDAMHDVHMGVTVEGLATRFQIDRDRQDEFALMSHRKAAVAIAAGRFNDEIVPVMTEDGGFFERDEHPRPGLSLDDLAKLAPVFDPDGSVTAGNSAGVNDGAAAVLVASEKAVERCAWEPMARIVSYASAGVEPMDMGLGPVVASRRALSKAGWSIGDLDLLELNEAFAAQALAVQQELELDPDKVNVNGGAIALGHPLAGSGCRIVVTLLHEMRRRDAKRGLASLCIGGGQGVAICLER